MAKRLRNRTFHTLLVGVEIGQIILKKNNLAISNKIETYVL